MELISRPISYGDMADIEEWFKAHKIAMGPLDLYPDTGIIVPGVMAGWVYLTNSRFAFLDNFISNPLATVRDRHLAIRLVTDKLLELAYNKGALYFSATTTVRSIAKLALQKGFRYAETTQRYIKVMELED